MRGWMGKLTFSASDQAAPLAPVLLGGLGSVSDIVFVDLGCLVVFGGIMLGCGRVGREKEVERVEAAISMECG
jgi:hypothetical protein